MGDILAWLLKKVFRYRYSVALINMTRSFPDFGYWNLPKTIGQFYTHLGEIIAETIWFSCSSHKRVQKSKIVRFTNPDLLVEYFEKSPSVTVLSTHCGNWELLGGLPDYRSASDEKIHISEKQITVVYKKMSSEVSDEVFKMNRIAPLELVGTECEVESSNILRYAIKHKDEKRLYIYPTDQAPYKNAGKHPIGEFMHQPTNVMLGSVGVACKLAHAVVYMKMRRLERGKYEMTFIPICKDASLMPPEEMMRKYYDLLEQELNETPCNWLWSHKRWK